MSVPRGYFYDLKISLIGAHFAYNAAFAATAAYLLGADERNIREGLASFVSGGMRMNVTHKNGVAVVADCYNAAPESMRAALGVLDMTAAVDGNPALRRNNEAVF